MLSRLRYTVLALLAAGALLAACGSATQPFPLPSGIDATPNDGSTPPGLQTSGRIKVTLTGSCRLLDEGSEMIVHYGAQAETGVVSRVQFLVDGDVVEDSGPISQESFLRSATLKVPDGATHNFQILAESGSAHSSLSTTVTCPEPPANGQRS